MFEKKLQVEKVEMVKKIVRQNNYSNYEKSHQQCIELGIKVNRPALEHFAKKLEQLDAGPKNKLEFEKAEPHQTNGSLVEYVDSQKNGSESRSISNDVENMTKEEAKARENSITYELGELKIREHALLQELARIMEKFDID